MRTQRLKNDLPPHTVMRLSSYRCRRRRRQGARPSRVVSVCQIDHRLQCFLLLSLSPLTSYFSSCHRVSKAYTSAVKEASLFRRLPLPESRYQHRVHPAALSFCTLQASCTRPQPDERSTAREYSVLSMISKPTFTQHECLDAFSANKTSRRLLCEQTPCSLQSKENTEYKTL